MKNISKKQKKTSNSRTPGRHSQSSFTDGTAVGIVKVILEKHKLIKPDLRDNDTWPNIDGYLEVVNGLGEPIGKLEAQIKSFDKGQSNTTFHFKDEKFFAYCEGEPMLPILFIGVDTENYKAYWIEMTPTLIKTIKGKTLHIPPENILDDSNKDYAKYWKEICEKKQQLLKDGEEAQKSSIKQLIASKPNSTLLKKNEVAIETILDNIKNKILTYEGLLFFISPSFINDTQTREKIRKHLDISSQQEELFIDELTKQGILSRTGDIIFFDDNDLGREKLSYLINKGEIDVEKTYDYFEGEKIRKQMLGKLADIPEEKKVEAFFTKLAQNFSDFIPKAKNNDDIYVNLELLEEYAHRVPDISVGIAREIINTKNVMPPMPLKSVLGAFNGSSHADLVKKSIDLLGKVKFLKTDEVFNLVTPLSKSTNLDVKKKALEAIKSLTKYNLFVLRNIEYMPQEIILKEVEKWSNEELLQNFDAIVEISRELLQPSFEGTSMTDYKTFTLSFGALKVSDKLFDLRKRTIALLKKLYSLLSDIHKKVKVLQILEEATRQPNQGSYGDDLVKMLINDTNLLIEFYLTITSQAEGAIIKEVEEQTHWFVKKYTKEKLPKVEELKKQLESSGEFQIFKVFFGFDYRYEEGVSWQEAKKEREDKIKEFVADVNEDNIELWEDRLKNAVKNYSPQDWGKFQYFNTFLHDLSKEKPELGLKLLLNLEKELEPFLTYMLSGIWESQNNKLARDLLKSWIDEGKHLQICIGIFFYVDDIDLTIIEEIYNKAKQEKDLPTINQVARLIANKFEGQEELKTIFLDALAILTSAENTNWIFFPFRKIKELIKSFSDTEINTVLDNLIFAKNVDHEIEEILLPIAEDYPIKVIDFFKNRVAQRLKSGKESKYDAIPYDFYEIRDTLAKDPVTIITSIIDWFKEKDWLYKWEASHLLEEIFQSFTPQLEGILIEMIKSNDKNQAEAVLMMLRGYKGNPSTHKVIKEFIKKYLRNPRSATYKDYLTEVNIILTEIGVTTGEYGIRDAFIRKKEEIQPWKKDKSKTIQDFVKDYEDYIDKQIAFQQKSADESIELMKKAFG